MASFLATDIQYLPGVGPQKAMYLRQELQLHTFEDLITYYPFRYEDRTCLHRIKDVRIGMPYVQITGTIVYSKMVSVGKKRLYAHFKDESGVIVLVWLKGLSWIAKQLKPGVTYTVYGRPLHYNEQLSLIHPTLEVTSSPATTRLGLFPIYHSTARLKAQHMDGKGLAKLQRNLLEKAIPHIVETLPTTLREHYQLLDKPTALLNIHFPRTYAFLQQARTRLKFEELFFLQLQLLQSKQVRMKKRTGKALHNTQLLHTFYKTGMPFVLTTAQKRVVKEVYQDIQSGYQMNRLLQGDVGSGKTIVAFLTMLICIGSGAQVAMMAPTELLAVQHYQGLRTFAQSMNLEIALLTGATKKKERTQILSALATGQLLIIIGTHALLNTEVRFNNLGLAIIDEQHRFGVSQRAQLWTKNQSYFPHVLVMTATPIPRTLAMTFYGDLDISIIDEMPAGRKPIKTMHYHDAQRLKVFQFLRTQIMASRQVYIVYPIIEEAKESPYKNLIDGYESIRRAFPEVPVGIIHGQMHASAKNYEMQQFVKGLTKLLVTTTVIEVGVNVPNATVMVIENAERFGLAQLHQLRGRVGRGSGQSYCLLMTNTKLNEKSKLRIQTMVRTNDGFKIADVDLQLRGPGDLLGVQQSGVLEFKIANLAQDSKLLQAAHKSAKSLLQKDLNLTCPQHAPIKAQLQRSYNHAVQWSSVG